MGGVCQFPQGAALFPIWCLLFIAIAMGIVCVCVCGGGGGWLVGPCLPPPTFLEENLIICLRRCHFVGKDTYGPCYRNGPATPATQLTVVPSHFQFCSHWPDKSLKKLTNIVFLFLFHRPSFPTG